ncbi:MAG: hypothetical protein K5640_06990 [Treponema sp.]|nr:hypothetical protein [Treponema sp.]
MFEKEAEEIANKILCPDTVCYYHCNSNTPKHRRCAEWHRCYDSAKNGAEVGYNKANEWHDLRKDPNDLPKEDCKIYLAYSFGDTEPSLYEYIASEEGQWEWMPRRIASLSNDQIRAWCEIPQFNPEE